MSADPPAASSPATPPARSHADSVGSNTGLPPPTLTSAATALPDLAPTTTGGTSGSSSDPRRTSSSSALSQRPTIRGRRQSRQERIEEILETAHQRSLTMRRYSQSQLSSTGNAFRDGGPISRTLSGNPMPPLASQATWETHAEEEEEEGSADERTSIIRNNREGSKDYQGTRSSIRSRRPSSLFPTNGRPMSGLSNRVENEVDDSDEDHETRWKKLLHKFGSLELDNKGSVARDHLALERTFLAWLRTSLAFASIGIAITQLFRLNTSLQGGSNSGHDSYVHLRQMGKPLGATFLGISIMTLFVGFHRYFESQHWIIRGKFPAGRGSVAVITAVAFALMVTSLVVVLVVEPAAFEK